MGYHRIPIFHTPQFNPAHFNIPRARYRAYRREANDFSCFTEEQINNIKIGGFYFAALCISVATLGPSFAVYLRTAQNPILSMLIEEMIQKTFQSTTQHNIGGGYSFPSGFLPIDTLEQKTSTACFAMVHRNQTALTGPLKYCNQLSSSFVRTLDKTNSVSTKIERFHYKDLAPGTAMGNLLLVSSITLTYATTRTYNMYRAGEHFFSPKTTAAKIDRLIILMIIAGLMLIGLEALTQCFGFLNPMSETSGIIPAACARACNAGFHERHSVNGTDYVFQHSNETINTPLLESFSGISNTTTAAILNIVTPPVTVLISKFTGLWARGRASQQPDEKHHHSDKNQKQYKP